MFVSELFFLCARQMDWGVSTLLNLWGIMKCFSVVCFVNSRVGAYKGNLTITRRSCAPWIMMLQGPTILMSRSRLFEALCKLIMPRNWFTYYSPGTSQYFRSDARQQVLQARRYT
ncbi:hypothetical protein K439DRAFT_1547987 [Ramaria rubella]|nr:hypothetical protein K439DRAFT_1547987 [Ramaria rubella]